MQINDWKTEQDAKIIRQERQKARELRQITMVEKPESGQYLLLL